MARCLIYREADGLVVNHVVWDGGPGWSPPEGHAAVFSDVGELGMTYDPKAGTFADPPEAEPVRPAKPPIERLIDKLIDDGRLDPSAKEAILATE